MSLPIERLQIEIPFRKPLTTARLVNGLSELACRNQEFREKSIEKTEFSFSQTDTGGIIIDFDFSAECLEGDDERWAIGFQYSATVKNPDARMPAEIAEDAYGLPYDEAIKEAGEVMLQHTVAFNVTSVYSSLETCESFTYMDEDGDVVYSGCTCNNDNYTADFQANHNDNADVPSHETASLISPEEALVQWALAETFDDSHNAYAYEQNLKLAFGTLGRIKDIAAQQARPRRRLKGKLLSFKA